MDAGLAAMSQRALDDHGGLGQQIGTPSDSEVEPLLRSCLDVGAVITQDGRTGLPIQFIFCKKSNQSQGRL